MSLALKIRNHVSVDGVPQRGAASRIAELAGVSASTVSTWFAGRFEPSIHVANRVRELLKMPKTDFVSLKTGPK